MIATAITPSRNRCGFNFSSTPRFPPRVPMSPERPSSSAHTTQIEQIATISQSSRGDPSRIPECHSLDDTLCYWNDGAPERGLITALNVWPNIYSSSAYASEAVKFGNIRFVTEEFTEHCDGSWLVFKELYSGLWHKYTRLLKAVRVAQK
jgi:hypothetical protein